MLTALQRSEDNSHSSAARPNGSNNLDQDLFHRIHAHRQYEALDPTPDLAAPSRSHRDNNEGTASPSLSDNDLSLFSSFVTGPNGDGTATRQHLDQPDIDTLFPLFQDLRARGVTTREIRPPTDGTYGDSVLAADPISSALDRWAARGIRRHDDTISPSQPDGFSAAPEEDSAGTQSSLTPGPAEGTDRARPGALSPQVPEWRVISDPEHLLRERMRREALRRRGVETSPPVQSPVQQLRDRYRPSPSRRRRGLPLVDYPQPSGRRHRVRYVDGLGDRDRSLSPDGDGVWDTLQSTLTPDPQPPSVGSSFTSTTSSAAASQTLSLPSSRTSISPGIEAEPPCDPVSEPDGTAQDSGNLAGQRVDRPRRPTPHGRRSYADVAADSYPNPDDPEWLSGMHRIVSGLASRQDIPDEWWAQAGLSRSMSWEGSN